MPSQLRAAWTDAAPPRPPTRRGQEAVVVGLPAAAVVLEGVLRPELDAYPWAVAAVAGLVLTLLWRRTRPLPALLVAVLGMSVVTDAAGVPDLYSSVFVLGLVYAVARWGSGRAALTGGAAMLGYAAVVSVVDGQTAGDTVGGLAVVGASLTLGAAMRLRDKARRRALHEVRLLEREHLARDLHDTVAHHVSAIAVRAQAGLAVAPQDPSAAAQALVVIEAEASRALAEMRTIVRVLRRDASTSDASTSDAPASPSPRLGDVADLADDTSVPQVRVTLVGPLAEVTAPVGAALYRMAQEAVTNAHRHARDATLVAVTVRVEARVVHLDVRDDGTPASRGEGYGLVGMRERAALLGGSCTAGVGPAGGWVVAATLPRTWPPS
ncbi:sensor histidine kinase [Cellulomonas sp. S1-8]|uniref:sensor histidine kinase n=1 Tax=Cellulomonas sp. S1-8 TaxID=2904790 RepID=UPI002244C912|nr:histidine kinase [Cellulomonas sp. S1-8]UZN02817.1 histidine kinase [Cellulomonas sp. S1-8]